MVKHGRIEKQLTTSTHVAMISHQKNDKSKNINPPLCEKVVVALCCYVFLSDVYKYFGWLQAMLSVY